jgi:ABC-type transport system substrate-binding protein
VLGVLTLLMQVALVLGLAACGGPDSNETASAGGSDVNAAPVKGGTLKVTFQGEPTALDPAIAWEVTSMIIGRLICEGCYCHPVRQLQLQEMWKLDRT